MANWTDQMKRERTRQEELGYGEEHDDTHTAQGTWDIPYQIWYTRLLEAALSGDVQTFRSRLVEFGAMSMSMGASMQRLGVPQMLPYPAPMQSKQTRRPT